MRLPFWSRPAPDERQHALATLQSLGTTSVPGLAAALSWSIPRTQKVLQDLLRQRPSSLAYDVRTGMIRWNVPMTSTARTPAPAPPGGMGKPVVAVPRATPRASTSPPPPLPSPAPRSEVRRPTVVPPTAPAPIPAPPSDHALRECARCHTPLVPTGVADVFSCPMCGRRISSAGTLVSPSSTRSPAPAGPDPRIQQLIAAWATGQPAPCPHCRQPLRHSSNGEFRCGSCGARVSYDTPDGTTPAPTPVDAGAPALGPNR